MSVCQQEEMAAGRSYPRTCPTCGLSGRCQRGKAATEPSYGTRLIAELDRLVAGISRTELARLVDFTDGAGLPMVRLTVTEGEFKGLRFVFGVDQTDEEGA